MPAEDEMPNYDYRCTKCGEVFEIYQPITDDALTKHPECGGKVNRIFAPVGIVFKGSGFHKTDSRSSSSGSRNNKSSSDSNSDGGSDSASSSSSGDSSSTSSSESSDKSGSSGSSDKGASSSGSGSASGNGSGSKSTDKGAAGAKKP